MGYCPEYILEKLEQRANQLRIESLKMIYRRQAGHPGGCLSSADIMAVLFFYKMRIDPQNPNWEERDIFILSKGHASALLYSALALRGFFPVETLEQWGDICCHLQGHPDRLKTPGVEMTSGLLGHGIAIGAGIAIASKMDRLPRRVYTLVGDGECQSGIIWEGAMFAGNKRLANLTVIVDYNDVQLDGFVHDIMPLEPFVNKWKAFNWEVIEINGHNVRQIVEAFDTAEEIHHRPTVIIAHTTKGKGVSFMENRSQWHGIPPNKEQFEQAINELTKQKVKREVY